jgi:carbon catabolite-derepressing protein kinase
MKEHDLERAHREVEIMQKLTHPNICKLYDVVETEDALNIVMEYAGGTLLAYVMERGGLSEVDAHRFFGQITSAIEYCHKLNIVHRFGKFLRIFSENFLKGYKTSEYIVGR